MKEILVLGVGNTIKGDDGVGILTVRVLKKQINLSVDIKETECGGLTLLDMISGYKKAIIVDSIYTEESRPLNVYWIEKNDFAKAIKPYSSHQIGLANIMKLADNLNIDIPKDISICAIEINKADYFCDTITKAAKAAVWRATDLIVKELNNYCSVIN